MNEYPKKYKKFEEFTVFAFKIRHDIFWGKIQGIKNSLGKKNFNSSSSYPQI